jgi:nucleotide-binding universal stress UspA family protein
MRSRLVHGAVVVGVDGSSHSELALEWAMRFAGGTRRPLVIMHAAGEVPARPLTTSVESRRQLRIRGRRVSDAALGHVRRHLPESDVQVVMETGDPASLLVAASDTANIVVLGSRGRGSMSSLLLGSVSVAVAARARCPVVVVRRTEDPAAKRIVVGVDGSASSTAAVELAFSEASRAGRPLTVLHTDPLASWSAWEPAPGRSVSDATLLVSEAVAGFREKFPDVEVTVAVTRGDPAPELVRESLGAAMVVVGSRGRGATRSLLLGSTSRYVVEHAHCTVAVAK